MCIRAYWNEPLVVQSGLHSGMFATSGRYSLSTCGGWLVEDGWSCIGADREVRRYLTVGLHFMWGSRGKQESGYSQFLGFSVLSEISISRNLGSRKGRDALVEMSDPRKPNPFQGNSNFRGGCRLLLLPCHLGNF